MVTKIVEFPRIPFPIDKVLFLGKYGTTKLDEFSEMFQGEGSFLIQKFVLQILDLYKGFFKINLQYNFSKMRGGRRPFGIFLKIHPI